MSGVAAPRPCLRAFYLLNLLFLFLLQLYIGRAALADLPLAGVLFLLAAAAGYGALYVGLVAGLCRLTGWLVGQALEPMLAVLMLSLLTILLLVDSQIYGMYGFHLNGFVWNLVTTPGGIESMGGSESASLTMVAICLLVVMLQGGLLLLTRSRSVPGLRYVVVVLVLCMVGERTVYGFSHLKGYRPVLMAAQSVPFYQPTTFRRAAEDWGIEMVRSVELDAEVSGRLNYPRHPLQTGGEAPRPNVMILVAESLRWDMLTPEIMPNLWRFAERHGTRFTDHLSGGNGTRMGIFSLFYGLPGNYWFSILDERRSPVVMDLLQKGDYRLGLFTSANFSYPEFDRTVFVNVPKENMVSDDKEEGWKRDRRNVRRLLDWLDANPADQPFMGFMFFESAHARYYFPEESVIREDFLPELNYATMDLEQDIEGIFNRYINASHHLDQQLGRVLAALEESGCLENTVVIITGDHGEEFMENGRWGHNSEFHQQQVRVPLVMAVPGRAPAVVTRPTSHMDVVPTLLPLLGVTNPASDYSIGTSLFAAHPDRPYRLVASWDALAYVGEDYKVAMPLKAGGLSEMTISTADDQPLADESAVLSRLRDALASVLNDISLFFRKL
ncbi:sulfatase-like hydrolase/transferase [Alcanivorax sp. DP30]|uniref:sulfatase-like hydrolase/transferase n=1 Tax=Alcanivorax sp. DP30 TaxID=2606217 RepID=UPI0013708B43|nr:sulfatase-like hydrolase/transferase [Alcanivorax sp. DP30]MZR62597.1 sulfatase-like hydrolase/transferase [Alcanivorax sp. DP30]